jgi:hypothetical protein
MIFQGVIKNNNFLLIMLSAERIEARYNRPAAGEMIYEG